MVFQGPINPQIFAGLVAEYADRLYSVAFRITGSHEEAEDATQDTFLSAYRQRATFRGESEIGTWLFRIAVNAALQRVRGRRPAAYLTATGYDSHAVVDWSDDLSRRVESAELRATLEAGIGLLPEDSRVVLILRDVEQLSTAETARVLDLSEPAVKSRLHRARVLLRQYLTEHLDLASR